MPIRFQVTRDGTFLKVEAWDTLTGEEVMAYFRELAEHPDLESGHITLFDARRVTSAKFDYKGIKEIALKQTEHPHKLIARKVAMVVGEKRNYLRAMQYETAARLIGQNTRVFTSVYDAIFWLEG